MFIKALTLSIVLSAVLSALSFAAQAENCREIPNFDTFADSYTDRLTLPKNVEALALLRCDQQYTVEKNTCEADHHHHFRNRNGTDFANCILLYTYWQSGSVYHAYAKARNPAYCCYF
jgi:hypothetical protein